jgi:ABC-2 type transport system permease protein
MLTTVLGKTLRDLRRPLVGWGVGFVVIVVLMAAIWPSMEDIFARDPDILAAYPEAMDRLFDLAGFATGAGFLNAELFSIVLPAMFVGFGIARGARLVAGEEQDGSLEIVLVTRISRTRLLLEKAAGLAIGLLVLGVVVFLAVVVSSPVVDMGIPVAHAAVGSLSMVLIGVQHGWLALAIGAATGRRSVAVAAATAVAVAGYLLHVLGALVDAIEPWQPLSPFTQAIGAGPVSGTVPAGFAWLALTAAVVLAAALPLFDRRDIATA